jgi:hypothetical protein
MARPFGTKYIKDPNTLLELWEEYKKTVGFDEIEQATAKGEIVTLKVKNPYLRSGFEAFAFRKLGHGIDQYLDNQLGNYSDYLGVVTCIRREWETDQVSGTMTGKYKAQTLTARLNGIKDSVDTNNVHSVKLLNIDPIENDKTDDSTSEGIST